MICDLPISTTLPGGGKWSARVSKGKVLRLTALDYGANVALWLYRADHPAERLNVPDTLKAQHTARLTRYHVLMSDEGRALATITEDSLGWHDPLGGITTREQIDMQYGSTSFQEQRNEWFKSGYENAVIEFVRNGLDARDLVPPVNVFSKVWCDEAGGMHFDVDHCVQGAQFAIRTEMDVIVILSNTPHPLDSRTEYPAVPVRLDVEVSHPIGRLDAAYSFLSPRVRWKILWH
ncbi:urea carboxylase [Alicyclobacillus sacchari]|uniref:urea amidolyase associated protein UAAP1 n=1 Tax=Alicyclobacillus sacchari TaxID=392010 RepID=UPI0023E93CA5|nr:urea amidolyase associated protein UAAP1 [Alicyclobacillus sacchari]GMA58672.1 urea carboxylase [Alicyclobacillus sacchari]